MLPGRVKLVHPGPAAVGYEAWRAGRPSGGRKAESRPLAKTTPRIVQIATLPRETLSQRTPLGILGLTHMDTTDEVALLEKALDRQLAWIDAANARTGAVTTLATAMLGVLAALSPAKGEVWTCPQVIVAGSVAAALAACLLMCALTLLPKTKGPSSSLIFFARIAGRDRDAFVKDVLSRTESDYLNDLAAQVHVNAAIAARKYAWVQRAMYIFFFSVLPWVVAVYFLYRD